MTLRDLIDRLTDLAEEYGEDTEVRLAFQPSWPFEHSIGEVAAVDPSEPHPQMEEDDAPGKTPVVYLGEGSQLGYLPGAAARELGWKE
jgi:hypothetical protein